MARRARQALALPLASLPRTVADLCDAIKVLIEEVLYNRRHKEYKMALKSGRSGLSLKSPACSFLAMTKIKSKKRG